MYSLIDHPTNFQLGNLLLEDLKVSMGCMRRVQKIVSRMHGASIALSHPPPRNYHILETKLNTISPRKFVHIMTSI